MLTKEECHKYWRNDVNKIDSSSLGCNNPLLYACKPITIVKFLHNFWSPEITTDMSILELGCNSGSNINHLRNLGYTNLTGIDINESAILKMQYLFPETFEKADLYIGSLEEILLTFPDKSFDVTFSIAVLEHIHPDTIHEVCKQTKRITKKYIVTCEDEAEILRKDRVFPRNYKLIFKHIGCKQIKCIPTTGIQQEEGVIYLKEDGNNIKAIKNIFEYSDYTTRMFV